MISKNMMWVTFTCAGRERRYRVCRECQVASTKAASNTLASARLYIKETREKRCWIAAWWLGVVGDTLARMGRQKTISDDYAGHRSHGFSRTGTCRDHA